VPPAYRPGGPRPTPYNSNLYARQDNLNRNAKAPGAPSARPAERMAKGGANNMYADSNGEVFRRNNDGSWQQRDKAGWSKPGASSGTLPAAGGSGLSDRAKVSPSPSGLERDYQARERGTSRTQSFERSSSSAPRSFSGGARRR
jgi:hypothetical protein